MSETATTTEEAQLEAEIRLLALLLTIFASIKIAASGVSYMSAVVSSGGVDEHGGHTFYWLPQLLFYTMLLTASRRLNRFDRFGRTSVMSLSVLAILATIVYTALDFTLGPASQHPAMAVAIKLRLLLAGGDIWDIVFPLLAIAWLRDPRTLPLFER